MSAAQASAAGQFELPIAHEKPRSKNIAPDDLANPAIVASVLTELSATLFPPVAEQLDGLSPASKQAVAVRANLRQLHSLGLLSDSELADFGGRAAECGQGDGGQMALVAAATRAGPVVSALVVPGASGLTYRPPSLPLDGPTPDAAQQQKGINRKQKQGAARRRLDLSPPAAAATAAADAALSTVTAFKTAPSDPRAGFNLACGCNSLGEPTPGPLARSESMSSLDEVEAIVGDATSEQQVNALLVHTSHTRTRPASEYPSLGPTPSCPVSPCALEII